MTNRRMLVQIQTVLSDFVDDGSSTAGDIINLRDELNLYLATLPADSNSLDWETLLRTTRKSAWSAAGFSVSLYELATALESESKKRQEAKEKGSDDVPQRK